MAPTLTDLVAKVRLESGLRNNTVISDQELAGFLTEAYADLRDRMIVRFASWFRAEQSFTLAGGKDGYIFDLSSLPDFQMAQGLDLVIGSDSATFMTITQLPSYAERNRFNGTWPFMTGAYAYSGAMGRQFWIDGDNLEVLPPQNAGGTYRLVYTPIQTFAEPVFNQAVAVTPGDIPFNHNGFVGLTIQGMTVTTAMLGGTIDADYDAPNAAWNATYLIDQSSTVGGHIVYTNTPFNPALVFTGGGSGSFNQNQLSPGTIYQLPAKLVPWTEYLTLYASITVKTLREQDIQSLETRFQQVKQRVIDLTKQRSETVKQAPITRARYGQGWGGNYGS